MGPLATLPATNAVLDELDRAHAQLSPPAQAAVAQVPGKLADPAATAGLTGTPGTTGGAGFPKTAETPQKPVSAVSAAPGPLATAPATAAPQPSRLAGPLEAAQHEQQRLATTGSGASQVHNPFLKTLATIGDVLGSGIAPRIGQFIPGTTAHHQVLVGQNERTVNSLENQQNEEQKRGLESAQQGEIPGREALTAAQTAEANANAQAKLHPTAKQEEAGKTITTDQGIMQWNPETQRYDIKAGGSPEKPTKETGTVHELEDGTLVVAHPDGTATAVTLNGKPVKAPPKAVPKETLDEKAVKEDQAAHPGESTTDALAHVKRATEKPDKPEDKGENYELNGKLLRIQPGQQIPPGAKRTNVAASEEIAGDKADKAALKARQDAADDYKLAQQFAAHPSPTNDVALVMHYIGATKPDALGKLRLNQNEMNLVLGTRSSFGDAQAFAQKVINGQKLTPQQRTDMLNTMKTISESHGGSTETSGPTATDANGKKVKWDGKAWVPQ